MTTAKVGFTIGSFTFSAEGTEKWAADQLDKVLARAEAIAQIAPSEPSGGNDEHTNGKPKKAGSLVSYIEKAGGSTNQTKRFLATAVWLHDRGSKRVTTADIAKSLRENSQKKLGNPSDCLSKNIRKGFCEKDGDQFFVTDDGRKDIGL